jgi:hypothetical protein
MEYARAGWTQNTHDTSYQDPDSRNIGKSKDVTDRFAIPDVRSNLSPLQEILLLT